MTNEEYKKIVQIARNHIPGLEGRKDLAPMYSDELDFIDVSVWCLEDALAAAYEAGKAAGKDLTK